MRDHADRHGSAGPDDPGHRRFLHRRTTFPCSCRSAAVARSGSIIQHCGFDWSADRPVPSRTRSGGSPVERFLLRIRGGVPSGLAADRTICKTETPVAEKDSSSPNAARLSPTYFCRSPALPARDAARRGPRRRRTVPATVLRRGAAARAGARGACRARPGWRRCPPDRRLPQGPFRPQARDDQAAPGPEPSGAAEGQHGGAGRPRRPHVLSGRRAGAAERRASCVRDERVAEAADLVASMRDALEKRGDPLPGGDPAELVDHLSGRPAGLGADARAAGRNTTSFSPTSPRAGVKTVDLRPPLAAVRRARGRPIF